VGAALEVEEARLKGRALQNLWLVHPRLEKRGRSARGVGAALEVEEARLKGRALQNLYRLRAGASSRSLDSAGVLCGDMTATAPDWKASRPLHRHSRIHKRRQIQRQSGVDFKQGLNHQTLRPAARTSQKSNGARLESESAATNATANSKTTAPDWKTSRPLHRHSQIHKRRQIQKQSGVVFKQGLNR
jgi:hypothetical protein